MPLVRVQLYLSESRMYGDRPGYSTQTRVDNVGTMGYAEQVRGTGKGERGGNEPS